MIFFFLSLLIKWATINKKNKKPTADDVTINPEQTRQIFGKLPAAIVLHFPDVWIVHLRLRNKQEQFVTGQPWFILLSISKRSVMVFDSIGTPCCWRTWCWAVLSLAEAFLLPASYRNAPWLQFSCGCLLLLEYALKIRADFYALYLCQNIGADDVTPLHLPPLSPPAPAWLMWVLGWNSLV